MEQRIIYGGGGAALTTEQINGVMRLIADRKAVLIEANCSRRGWSAGYAVQVEGRYYWFPRGGDTYHQFPAFVREEEDALEFIQSAESWYSVGMNDGVKYARSRMLQWVDKHILNEL